MCGIFGMVSIRGEALRYPEALARMGETIRHRGPDSSGSVTLPHAALGANRLRIVDLDPRADQPFTDPASCVSLVFNGEIYNAPELRRQFPSYPFRSRSDAEVVLPLYREQGAKGLSRIEGMFALAIWDDANRRLILARDRAGEKPLFYAATQHEILFASEVQALLAHPDVSRELDGDSLQEYLAFGYVREPRTMLRSIRKIGARTMVRWSDGRMVSEPLHAHGAAREDQSDHLTIRPSDHLLSLLESSVRRQLAADVPVGVFLSGGVDSSLIAALAAREGVKRTFTVRFEASSYDEGAPARRVAQLIGSEHHEVLADDAALGAAFEKVRSSVAEPIADPAILPTYLLARSAREHVGVVLGGEGADELFGGYPAYIGHRLAPWVRWWLPLVAKLLPQSSSAVPLTSLIRLLAQQAGAPWDERHVAWMGTGLDGCRLPVAGCRERTTGNQQPVTGNRSSVLGDAMRLDYQTYLRDRLLPKIDRATMLCSLEARAPYLDPAVTDFAFGLPTPLRVRGLTTKWILKQAASALLPRDVVHRRKRGLSVPVSQVMNGSLRERVDALLDPARLSRQGLLNPAAASELLCRHRAGDFGVARGLWALVVLQAWMETWN